MRLTGLLLMGCLVSCSTPLPSLRKELDARSSSDLGCPEKDLRYKELDHMISTTKVAVSGCGKTVKYKFIESRWTLIHE